MSLWFSGSAVVPALTKEWHLSANAANWLTLSVQLGFVVGTLLSALLNLPDIISPRHLFTLTACLGAIANAAFGWFAHDASKGIVLRFLTGMFLAGVYPPAMKILATWFRHGRGLALGVLVGALTLGKAAPYLVNGIGSSNWRYNVIFLRHTIDSEDILAELPANSEVEEVLYRPGTLLWSAQAEQMSQTKMSKLSSRKISQDMTVRNLNTTKKLYELIKKAAERD